MADSLLVDGRFISSGTPHLSLDCSKSIISEDYRQSDVTGAGKSIIAVIQFFNPDDTGFIEDNPVVGEIIDFILF